VLTVRVEGLRELDEALKQLTRTTGKNTAFRTLLKAAEPIVETASVLAPDDLRTGPPDLHTSIKATKRPKPRRTVWVDIAPFAPLERNEKTGKVTGRYFAAGALERGVGDMPAQPYMRPAFDAHRQSTLATIKYELGEEIKKSVARQAKRRGL
jgi:HK97 gp10 family phage protein